MFSKEDIIEDTLHDDIRPFLDKVKQPGPWNKAKQDAKAELINLLKNKKYIAFPGHYSRYHLNRVGESCLYDVPESRRGYLKPFRGKRIRVVCVGHEKFYRKLMAGVI